MQSGKKKRYYYKNYKYCIVPMCKNTTARTPYKLFFNVPRSAEVRRKWCQVIKRDEQKNGQLSAKSSLFCCEDHFILEEDTENYMQYKIMYKQQRQQVTLRLKKGIFPHIFQCQKRTESEPERKLELLQETLTLDNGLPQTTTVNTEKECEARLSTSDDILHRETWSHDIYIQVNKEPEYHSKGLNTRANGISVAISPFQKPSISTSTSPFKIVGVTRNKEKKGSDTIYLQFMTSESSATTIQYEPGSSNFEASWLEEQESNREFLNMMHAGMLIAIEKEPKLLLGLPKESYYLIKLLSENIPAPTKDLLITLKKIKLNDSFSVLASHFGYSQRTVSNVIGKTIFLLADNLKDLIVWPNSSRVAFHLPIPFRVRYSNVISIIDCLEIEIKQPANVVHQSLTWSQYRCCNTLKYLISCTPDGLVNFISAGYGGRASDATIVEDCGYLEKLPPNVAVMAERRFKNISHMLQSKSCVLIRPPSVSSTLASVRLHVDCVIGRLKEFNMLLPDARTDFLTPLMDHVLITACGIINMQKCLTENQI